VLGHFLLQVRLLPLLARGTASTAAAASVIVNVSSVVHRCGAVDMRWLQAMPTRGNQQQQQQRAGEYISANGGGCDESTYSPHGAYAQSKLLVLMLSLTLADKLSVAAAAKTAAGGRGSGPVVRVQAVHPGVVRTALYRHVHPLLQPLQSVVAALLFLPPTSAARVGGSLSTLQAQFGLGGFASFSLHLSARLFLLSHKVSTSLVVFLLALRLFLISPCALFLLSQCAVPAFPVL
jgi:NAD(P)-dependent dehydrogenase (short-subunit alcohol dehydrogenase family)